MVILFAVPNIIYLGIACFHITDVVDTLSDRICVQYTNYFDMITSSNGNIFHVRSWNNGMRCMSYYVLTEPLCGELSGDRLIPLTKASDEELLFFN